MNKLLKMRHEKFKFFPTSPSFANLQYIKLSLKVHPNTLLAPPRVKVCYRLQFQLLWYFSELMKFLTLCTASQLAVQHKVQNLFVNNDTGRPITSKCLLSSSKKFHWKVTETEFVGQHHHHHSCLENCIQISFFFYDWRTDCLKNNSWFRAL